MDLCRSCGTHKRWFDRALSLGPYDSAWGELIRKFKFDKEQAVSKFLAEQMANYLTNQGLSQDIDIITYVPMTRRSMHQRGFNQAKLLALSVGHQIDRPVARLVRKVRETMPQAGLSAQQRQKNLRGAFKPIRSVSGNVLLIDDIFTTGSTVEECSHALKDGGCKEVMVLTVARA
jgi:ComF family protein